MERVFFYPAENTKTEVEVAYNAHLEKLRELLPDAEIHHIGSTNIPNSITKGDLDILVRVMEIDFAAADRVLATNYERNVGSDHTATFSSFKKDDPVPPLGIQLCAIGGPYDDFLNLRDILTANPALNEEYNGIKRAFHGRLMDEYRVAKSAFLERILK